MSDYPAHHDLSMHEIPDRTGDPLLCSDLAVVEMIAYVAYNAWRQMGSTHNAAPCAQALSHRIMHPQAGDPVYVPDSFRRSASADHRRKGIGYFVVERMEWYQTDEEWAEEVADWGDSPRPTDQVFYVQHGPDPGDICRWEDASCHTIPYGEQMMSDINAMATEIVRKGGVPV